LHLTIESVSKDQHSSVRLRIDLRNPIEIIFNVDGIGWAPHRSPLTKQFNIDLHLNNSVP